MPALPSIGSSSAAPTASPYLGGGAIGGTSGSTIGGSLPFNNPGTIDFSGNPSNLGADYASAYTSALNFNSQNYANVLAGYQATSAQQQAAEQQTQQGYGALQNQVMNTIQGITASQQQAISDSYAQQTGQNNQQLIDRGLGNTTIQQSTDRGLMLDKQKANVALANQQAQLTAGYQSNLGLAGLNYQNQSTLQNSAQNDQQLGWMNSVNAPYPNSGLYAQLAQQYGAAQQANANRSLQAQLASRMMGAAGQGGGGGGQAMGSAFGPQPSYAPQPAPSYSAFGSGTNPALQQATSPYSYSGQITGESGLDGEQEGGSGYLPNDWSGYGSGDLGGGGDYA